MSNHILQIRPCPLVHWLCSPIRIHGSALYLTAFVNVTNVVVHGLHDVRFEKKTQFVVNLTACRSVVIGRLEKKSVGKCQYNVILLDLLRINLGVDDIIRSFNEAYGVCWQSYYRHFRNLAFLMSKFSPNACQSWWFLNWAAIFCLLLRIEVKLRGNYSCSCFHKDHNLGILSLFSSQWMCFLIMFIKDGQTATMAKIIRRNTIIWRDRST